MTSNTQDVDNVKPVDTRHRVFILDPLRGLAALSVVWYHFSSTGNFTDAEYLSKWLTASGKNAWAGVEIFFVISGFVLPYALSKNGYRLHHYGLFLWKRLVRLEPPYLVSIAIVLLIAAISPLAPSFHGEAFHWDWPRLFSHLGYLSSFLHYQWYNIVYWTLAIELQFYLSIALLFPLLVHRNIATRMVVVAGLLLLSLLSSQDYLLFKYLPFFSLGIVSFQYYSGLMRPLAWWFWIVLGACFCFYTLGMAATLFAVGAAMAIAAAKSFEGSSQTGSPAWQFLTWMGTLSYSLYLLHVPVGGRVINLGARFVSGPLGQIVVLALAILLSLFASWLLHRFVEKPSQRWSANIKFRDPPVPDVIIGKKGDTF